MTKVKVDHTGSCISNKTKTAHHFSAGIPVEVPDDVVDALGNHAEIIEKPAAPKAQQKPVAKEVKPEVDKMIKAGQTITK